MIETSRLVITDRQLKDIPMEELYLTLHPELNELDPTVGECRGPVFFSVFTKQEGRHIGTCSLYNFTRSNAELGVRIFDPEYWDKGYGSEIVKALCSYVFICFSPIEAMFAKTPVYNTRAIRCYEKCGFREHSRKVVDGYDMVYMIRYESEV